MSWSCLLTPLSSSSLTPAFIGSLAGYPMCWPALKGEYEDYSCGVWPELSRLSPFMSAITYLGPWIPHSAIAKTILIRSLIFNIFKRVENQPLKQRSKQKRRIFLQTYDTFSHSSSYRNIFCFMKIYNFRFN